MKWFKYVWIIIFISIYLFITFNVFIKLKYLNLQKWLKDYGYYWIIAHIFFLFLLSLASYCDYIMEIK